MLFSHHAELKRDLRNARRVLWWSLGMNILLGALASFSLSYGLYALTVLATAVLSVLFSYLLFLGFSRLAKHFHAMRLFWFFVVSFILNIFILVIDVIDKITYYQSYDPYHSVMLGMSGLVGAVMLFGYGYLIMDLSEKKFGKLLFRARMSNIALAIIASIFVTLTADYVEGDPFDALTLLVWLINVTLIIVTTVIDYRILGTSLRLLGGVLPRPAPTPHSST